MKSTCSTSAATPASTLKVPKNIASSSVAGMYSFAMALNCQPATVVTNAASHTTEAIAVKYDDWRTWLKLAHSPPDAVSARSKS